MKKLKPVIPGELLLEEFLKPMGLSQYRLAKAIGVPAQRISEIVAGKRAVTADTDLRLCRFFGLSNGYWLRMTLRWLRKLSPSLWTRSTHGRGLSPRACPEPAPLGRTHCYPVASHL